MLKLFYTPCMHIILLSPYINLKALMISITVCSICYSIEEVFLQLSRLRTDSLPAYVTMLDFDACSLSQHVYQLNSIFKHGSQSF